jgi:acetolactate synthase-1/2/3 large subunit/sulfoacetaldehyde acetyltransferase
MPRDVLSHQVEFEAKTPDLYRPLTGPGPNPDTIGRAVALLATAKKPLLVAGSGLKWSRGSASLVSLVEALQIPFVTSNANRDLVPNDHPLFFGQLGPRGSSVARELAQEADVIFALGTRLGFTTGFFNYGFINESAKLIHNDIEASEIGRIYPVALAIVGDAKAVAEACVAEVRRLNARLEIRLWNDWARARREEWQTQRDAGALDPAVPIRTRRFFAELRKAVPKNVHVVTDAGYWGNTATDAFDHFACPSLVTPQEFGCLGFSFPASLGVKFAKPDVPVVCINGDGGFAMNMQELETAMRCRLNPVILVLNNFSWGVEKSYQKDFFQERYVGANIGNPRFDRLAEAFGARGVRVEKADEIGDVVRDALKSDLPTVVDVIVDPAEMSGLRRDAVVPRGQSRPA